MHLNLRTALFTIPTLYQVRICERILLYCFDSFDSLVGTRSGYYKCAPVDHRWPDSIVYGSYWTYGCSPLTPSWTPTFSAFPAPIGSFSPSLASTAPSTPRTTGDSIDVPSRLLAHCAEAQACIVSSFVSSVLDSFSSLCLVRLYCLSHGDDLDLRLVRR